MQQKEQRVIDCGAGHHVIEAPQSHEKPASEKSGADEQEFCGCSHGDSGNDRGGSEGISIRNQLVIIALAGALFLVGLFYRSALHNTPLSFGEYLALISAYLIAGWGVLSSAGRNILRGKIFDENFLMTVATLGAIAIHQLPEAVGVMLFFKVGEFFQELSVSRSRKSIQSLLEIRPDHANLVIDGKIRKVAPEDVTVGDTITVKPGERIPLDGEVLEGSSQVDTSALTGEPVPRFARPGGSILAGMINKTGSLTIRVTKPFSESSLSKIIHLVENAGSRKAPTEKFITRFAGYYTPVVVLLALGVAFIPPFVIEGASFSAWFYRALILLVISCPCALVVSIPLSYFGGVGGASRRGILVKGSNYLDVLNGVKTIVFDKTGTLTKGVFKVCEIAPRNGASKEELLRLAAHAEAHSNHPIAQSVLSAYDGTVNFDVIEDYQEIAGYGIKTVVERSTVLAGNDKLMHQGNIPHEACEVEGTVVHVASDNVYQGYILIADEIKEDAPQAIHDLRDIGVEQVMMFTGDNKRAAAGIADRLGLDSHLAELLPEDKVAALEKLMREGDGRGKMAFVGDGINDAPVLVRSDVGIAMGDLGSDAAIDTADVVLMTDAPSKVAEAIRIAKKTHRIVWQNIVLALSVKGAIILLGAVGLATMWEAVFADVGVALLAIFNATRILKFPAKSFVRTS